MPTYQNYTMPDLNHTAVSNLAGLYVWANTATSGGFGLGMAVAFLMICMGTLYTYTKSFRKAFAPSMFITTIIMIMMRGIDLITNDFYIVTAIALLAGSVIWLWYGED